MTVAPFACPLCNSPTETCHRDRRRIYRDCPVCLAVHVPADFHLSPADEKAEYDKHQNATDDAGYRRFLNRLAEPICSHLSAGSSGLDFGCGPGPALAAMLTERGHWMALYDLYYQPDSSVLQKSYDFITATEVVEHLAHPRQVLDMLWQRLRPGGVLALMTKRVTDREAFSRWHYKNDPTHIVFFHEQSFRWLAQQWQCQLEFPAADVVFLLK